MLPGLFKDTGGLDPTQCVKLLVSVQSAWFDKVGVGVEERGELFGEMPRCDISHFLLRFLLQFCSCLLRFRL